MNNTELSITKKRICEAEAADEIYNYLLYKISDYETDSAAYADKWAEQLAADPDTTDDYYLRASLTCSAKSEYFKSIIKSVIK